MKPKPKEMVEGKTALDNFTRTMERLFRVRKAEIQEPKRKSKHSVQMKPRG